ncbi:MAG: DNA polymerase Y family protein [Corynebacteriales bacterium]|nr:DNA polymerase Y family protein [Mycobacteriales bacterium]
MPAHQLPPRTAAVLCPDWPVLAALAEAELPAAAPAAILHDRRIAALSTAARQAGVRIGMRQRDAQALCPQLRLLPADSGRDARLFEQVIAAVEDHAAGVQVLRPGLCVFTASGPARYSGSEEKLAEQLVDHIATVTGFEAFVGFAEGVFAAALAAARPMVVPIGGTPQFLADVNVSVLGDAELVSVLQRCGIYRLGQLAELPERSVITRFGAPGTVAYRLATARQETPIVARAPEQEIQEHITLDPPADRIAVATAAVHTLAEKFTAALGERGWVCTVLRIDAATENDVLSRTWRADEIFTPAQIAARLRWQLEAWLTSVRKPESGVHQLRLIAEQVSAAGRMQLGLWGGKGEAEHRARQAIDRAQDLLGVHAVTVATSTGGRLPKAQTLHLPWRDEQQVKTDDAPWPDNVPAPIATPPSPVPVVLLDAHRQEVHIRARHALSAPPVTVERENSATVTNWAGPWPLHERWWEPEQEHRGAWLQIVVAHSPGYESALLLFYDTKRWWLVGSYD